MRFVIDARFVRQRPSGIGTYVEALVERLPTLAPEATFRLWTHPERPRPTRAPNVTHRPLRAHADGLRTLLWPTALDQLGDADVVHFPHGLLGRGLRCATVVTVHDLMWLEHPEWVDRRPLVRQVRKRFYQQGLRWALEHATRILAVSEATGDRIRAWAPHAADRIRVTRNAVSSVFQPAGDLESAKRAAAKLIGSAAPYYLVVGKNEPYKAHDTALRAFAAGARPEESLVLLQRVGHRESLGRLAERLGVRNRVHALPSVPQTDLVTLLQAARALLQPSRVEGFGIPVLEAMASGCPVVASETPALLEVLGGAGLTAPVDDVEGLAAAVRRLHDGSLRSQLRARGLERARAFSWETTARATLEAYREAAREVPRRSSEPRPTWNAGT